MKMILAIVQDEDAGQLLDKLAERGQRATKISSTGGFLRSGNTTLLMGAADEAVQSVLDVIRATCRPRKQPSSAALAPRQKLKAALTSHATEVEVGGANVFIWKVEQYIRI
jgi:uncharacterized protein YaaQ